MSMLSLLLWLLVTAIIIHTLAEASAPRRIAGQGLRAVFDRAIWLDKLPTFIALLMAGILGSQWSILTGIIPTVAIAHPLLDHVALSVVYRKLRPGSGTALFLMLPLGVVFYGLAYQQDWLQSIDILVGGSIGLAISLRLLWSVIKFPD
jgi:Protein of unknown function with HXXEE motif